MKEFSLIKQLDDEDKDSSRILPDGIEYQQYELHVEGNDRVVNIPVREALNFEKVVTEMTDPLTRNTLKQLLREFRGIRG